MLPAADRHTADVNNNNNNNNNDDDDDDDDGDEGAIRDLFYNLLTAP